MTLSITKICHYAECRILLIVMLSVIMLSVIMLSAGMLSVVMLSVVVPFFAAIINKLEYLSLSPLSNVYSQG